jgi:nucleoside-diphosphate-sugar epimerase
MKYSLFEGFQLQCFRNETKKSPKELYYVFGEETNFYPCVGCLIKFRLDVVRPVDLEKAMRGEKLEIWGDGNGKKDYIFITDFCKILFSLINKSTYQYEVLNIGSGELLSVNEIAETIKDKLVSTFEWDYRQLNNLDVSAFKLDLSKLHSILEDFNYTSFDEGLDLTFEWYQNKQK